MGENEGKRKNVKILLSKAQIYNTSNDYGTLKKKLDDWKGQMEALDKVLLHSNAGNYTVYSSTQLKKYLNGEMTDLINEAELTHTTLVEATTQCKTLLARCADFPNILRDGTGEGEGEITDYSNVSTGSLNLLYFDDVYCKEEAGYAGEIKDHTDTIDDESTVMSDNLDDLVKLLEQLESTTASIGSYKSVLDECIDKHPHVSELYQSLVAYGQGVKALNDYVSEQFKNYNEIELSLLTHRRSFTYDGLRTDDLEYISQARLLDEGLTEEEIDNAVKNAGITRKELADAYIGADDVNKTFIEQVIKGNFEEAFMTDPDYITDESLFIASCAHAHQLKSAGDDYSCPEFEKTNNWLYSRVDSKYLERMATIATRETAKLNKDSEFYNERLATAHLYTYEYPKASIKLGDSKICDLKYSNGFISGKYKSTIETQGGKKNVTIINAFNLLQDGTVKEYNMSAEELAAMTPEEQDKFIKEIEKDLIKCIPEGDLECVSAEYPVLIGPNLEIVYKYKYELRAGAHDGNTAAHIKKDKDNTVIAVDAFDVQCNDNAKVTFGGSSGEVNYKITDNTHVVGGYGQNGAYYGVEAVYDYEGGQTTVGVKKATNTTTIYTQSVSDVSELDTETTITYNPDPDYQYQPQYQVQPSPAPSWNPCPVDSEWYQVVEFIIETGYVIWEFSQYVPAFG